MNVGTAELRNRFSFFLKKVQNGMRVVVMDRGRPVAQLVPYEPGREDLAERILEMADEGVVAAQPVRQRPAIEPIALRRPGVLASRLVSELRDGR